MSSPIYMLSNTNSLFIAIFQATLFYTTKTCICLFEVFFYHFCKEFISISWQTHAYEIVLNGNWTKKTSKNYKQVKTNFYTESFKQIV